MPDGAAISIPRAPGAAIPAGTVNDCNQAEAEIGQYSDGRNKQPDVQTQLRPSCVG